MASAVAGELELLHVPADDPEAAALLAAYAAELEARGVDREAGRTDTIASEYRSPDGAFLVMREDGRPVACGGVRRLGDGVGELKRMYVVPGARGRGLGRRMLTALEHEAGQLGYVTLRLD